MLFPFKKTYSKHERRLFRFLQKNYLFRKLNENELAEFLPYMYPRHYEKGEVIFFRNDPSQALYLVNKGVVALNLDVSDKFEELTRLKTADAFGDNALLEDKKRVYNAICFSDQCELYVIPTVNIYDIFEHNAKIRAKVMTSMAENYDRYMSNLFRSYQDAYGFFDLGMAFNATNQ
ncbi:cyclic nucleotide-binding domain-containing protein [Sediminitomix flava]|uniref:Cyclic nucleotide-binding domain-containing protein n=1 Tax=Sediminitomix flava TaxID=379075 RepID=A0A315ZBS7_SEDFL|nr:cyclic nucleotide-binding domain-containing protein [Sediminitomix flava]PWJ42533.1 Cyclic nucleotide-binding domain-containing protein [Sediminitomix flava]